MTDELDFPEVPLDKSDVIELGGVPGCGYCARLRDLGDPDSGLEWTCDAFPSGIPTAIVLRRADHTVPFPGDNGLQYTPRVIVPDGKRVGYCFTWDGDSVHADTHQPVTRYSDVR